MCIRDRRRTNTPGILPRSTIPESGSHTRGFNLRLSRQAISRLEGYPTTSSTGLIFRLSRNSPTMELNTRVLPNPVTVSYTHLHDFITAD